MMRRATAAALLLAAAAPLPAQSTGQSTASDPTSFSAAADVRAEVAALAKSMKPGQGFAYRPLVRGSADVAGLEIWKAPGKPAVHPSQAEYVIVIEGAGTLVSGGRMMDARVTRPGLTEGSRIEGGTTRSLHTGDVALIPAGTPHWFGVDGHLVLLGIKLPGVPTDG